MMVCPRVGYLPHGLTGQLKNLLKHAMPVCYRAMMGFMLG